MGRHPRRRYFPLPDTRQPVWYGSGACPAEGTLYIPKLKYGERRADVSGLAFRGRTPEGERFPEEIRDSLLKLSVLVGDGVLADNESEERMAAEKALTFLRESQAAFEKHDLPEPKLLTQLQIDLTRVRNEIDRDQSEGRQH